MKEIDRLTGIMRHLRTSPDGCAWSKDQTHKSLIPSLIEESYETAEAIDEGRPDAEICSELGDILLQVVFHAQMAEERGAFTFDDVAKAISDKLVRRYPTILGDKPNTLKTAEEIDRQWEEIKTQERLAKGIDPARASILDDVSHALPALMRAAKLKGRMAKAGWEWPDSAMLLDKIVEEAAELRAEIEAEKIDKTRAAAEIGDLLFMIVDLARWYGIDAEDALRETSNRFEKRCRHMERGLKENGKDFKTSAREERKRLWEEAKAAEK